MATFFCVDSTSSTIHLFHSSMIQRRRRRRRGERCLPLNPKPSMIRRRRVGRRGERGLEEVEDANNID